MEPEAFREVLRSPLDERPPPSPGRRLLLTACGGLLVGALAVLPWALRGGTAESVAPLTTVATAPPTPVGLHPGYAALDAGRGLRVEWIHHSGDVVLVTVGCTIPSDRDREHTAPLGTSTLFEAGTRAVGRWELCLESGRCVAPLYEVHDPRAEGMVTVVFPAGGIVPIDAGSIDHLALFPVTGAGTRQVTVTYAAGDLPSVRPDPGISIPATELVEAGAGADADRTGLSYLVVDHLEIDTDHGAVVWHFDGPADVGPMLRGVLTLAGSTENPALLIPADQVAVPLPGRDPMPPTPERRGTLQLLKASHTGAGDYRVRSIEASWQVSWARYGTDSLEVPLDHLRRDP